MTARTAHATGLARKLRQKDNDAEARLWNALRNRRLHGYKFVRELSIGPYFADFACRRKKLIVESVGSQHIDSEYDLMRDRYLNDQGWSVLRVHSCDVLSETSNVLELIVSILEKRHWESEENREWIFRPARRENS